MKTRILFFILSFFTFGAVHAQSTPEMADAMRAEGKIYVVVAIILTVLIGLVVYLLLIDRKVKKLENLLEEKQRQTK